MLTIKAASFGLVLLLDLLFASAFCALQDRSRPNEAQRS